MVWYSMVWCRVSPANCSQTWIRPQEFFPLPPNLASWGFHRSSYRWQGIEVVPQWAGACPSLCLSAASGRWRLDCCWAFPKQTADSAGWGHRYHREILSPKSGVVMGNSVSNLLQVLEPGNNLLTPHHSWEEANSPFQGLTEAHSHQKACTFTSSNLGKECFQSKALLGRGFTLTWDRVVLEGCFFPLMSKTDPHIDKVSPLKMPGSEGGGSKARCLGCPITSPSFKTNSHPWLVKLRRGTQSHFP